MANKFKKYLFLLMLGCLFIPMLQDAFELVEETPLKGAVEHVNRPTNPTLKTWLDGTYQAAFSKYSSHNFGFRNDLVRLHNQLDYNFFKEANARQVVVGQEGYLYEEDYIKAYLGKDFLGDSTILARAEQLKKVRDTLLKTGTDVLVIFAAGKGSFFPEYFPDNYRGVEPKRTNYQAYLEVYAEKGIPYLDFNQWFMDMRDTATHPLYAKGGIHWSKYGEYLVMDSMRNYLSNYFEKSLPKIVLDTLIVSEKNLDTDYDIGDGMNLIYETPTYPMTYPTFHFEKDSTSFQPQILMVADSYYWGIFHYGMSKEVFNNGDFWFNGYQLAPGRPNFSNSVGDLNIQAEVEKNDLVILMSTDAGLDYFPFRFDERLVPIYFGETMNE